MRRGTLYIFLLASSIGSALHPARAQMSPTEVRLAAFGGPAYFTSALSRPYNMAMSADATLYPLPCRNLVSGVLVEGGVYHPAISGTGNYYLSTDALLTRIQPDWATEAMRLRPYLVAGYTRFFNATGSATGASSSSGSASSSTTPSGSLTTSNAANLGIGVDRVINDDLWLRFEIRENYTPDGGSHALVLRIGIVAVGSLQ